MILLYIINLLFTVYTFLLLIRVFGSWFPRFSNTTFMHFIAFYTDPYLKLFRKILPPLGGMIDLSPMLAFLALQLLRGLLITILR